MKYSLLFLLLIFLLPAALSAQGSGTTPKIGNDENLAMKKAKTKAGDKKMGLPGPRRTETVENTTVAAALETLQAGDTKAAIDQLDDFAKTDADAAYGLGLAYHEKNLLPKAIEALQYALQLDPSHSDAMYELGQIYFEQDEYGLAEAMFLKMLGENPRDADAWYELGFLYSLNPELYESAEQCLNESLSIEPNDPYTHYAMGCLQALQNQPDQALTHLEQAFKNGFKEAEVVREDPDLESLRADNRFQQLMRAYFPD